MRIGADRVGGGTGDGLAGTGGHGVDDAVGGGVHDRHGLAQGGVAPIPVGEVMEVSRISIELANQ